MFQKRRIQQQPLRVSDPKRSLNNYARYSSIAIQMVVIIILGVFGGYKLDMWLNTQPILTVILSLLSVFIAIYLVTKDLLKKRNHK
ncbi:MAG: AtpZ/AtpI family protein [Bacteroidales bacterium]|nr:AtpZ/AtpI family protein [Bacteroidales bacterium]